MAKPSKPVEAPESVATAAASGDPLRLRIAMRAHIASLLMEAGQREAPALSTQLRALDSEIQELQAKSVEAVDVVNELAKRRQDRIAAANVAGSSVRRVRQRAR